MLPLQPLTPPPSIAVPDAAALSLRVGQRLNASVLDIANDHITLVAEGARLTAQLVGHPETADLEPGKVAHFVVRGMKDGALQLEVAPRPQSSPAQGSSRAEPLPLARAMLSDLGLEPTAENEQLATALLKAQVPVTRANLRELATAMEQIGEWRPEDAAAAAQLKAQGKPITPGTIELAQTPLPSPSETMKNLAQTLAAIKPGTLPKEVAQAVQQALGQLERIKVQWQSNSGALHQELHDALRVLGHSIERELAQKALDPQQPSSPLMELAKLSQQLDASSNPAAKAAASEIRTFIDGLRQTALANLPPDRPQAEPHAYQVALPLQVPGQAQASSGFLRVTTRDGRSADVHAQMTRVTLRIPLDGEDLIEVDLSVLGKQIGAWVTASSEDVQTAAEAEMSELQIGLSRAGYTLKTARCLVGVPLVTDPAPSSPIFDPAAAGVNMKV